jgi:hypothetical protein
MRVPTMPAKCLDCHNPMTWTSQPEQVARLVKRGFTADEAKQLMPRCQKCVTELLGTGKYRAHGRRTA